MYLVSRAGLIAAILMRHVIWSLIAAFVLASCSGENGTQRSGTLTSEPAGILPKEFYGATKLEHDSNGAVSLLQGENLSHPIVVV